jgi:enediyne polyketide synthase
MTPAIAIVGMSCRYPDANSPHELWENVLAQRQAFRRIPSERLHLEDYFSADRQAPDRIYASEAALLEGYDFDRVKFRVAGSTFRSADLAHWLALHVASEALADAGFADGVGLPRSTTGVLLGNTLTGEFSRANLMRLRWPYVRRHVGAALLEIDWPSDQRQAFLDRLEHAYKAPFPPVGEETLAGGLSNTIAGRICNYFDLHGGGYSVDGACASSLLAVTTACSALLMEDLDVALAGGVDLSLDPFELVGFAKTGALADEKMRVYDSRSAGFWPGEGCGFLVLMRQADALAQGRRIYATIRGWGVSSDGSGGITRPEVEGQLLAVQRAYRRAAFGVETVGYFEGHGTGTSVGDSTELRMLTHARQAGAAERPAPIGSIKANIGHTKAAAGVAGLIKATLSIYTQIVPPTTGCETPHQELTGPAPMLQVLNQGMLWPMDQPLRAGVSAMGFGGINTHVVLESATAERRIAVTEEERRLLMSAQDAELLLLSATTSADLRQQLEQIAARAMTLSRSEVADLAADLEQRCADHPIRAALVVATPAELVSGCRTLQNWLAQGATQSMDLRMGIFLGSAVSKPRIGFLFPGQGAPSYTNGGTFRQRFAVVNEIYERASLPTSGDGVTTAIAQPAIVTSSLAALRLMEHLGIEAAVGLGHSLGEITAFHWAGAFDAEALLRIATVRGRAMADLGNPTGAMASIGAGRQQIGWLLNDDAVTIACLNSPQQTVISGETDAVNAVIERARARGLQATRLPVSHAFHSPLVAAAAAPLAEHLASESIQLLQRTVVSTITGAQLAPGVDLRTLLYQQVTAPVRFIEAVIAADAAVDLWIETGPGHMLNSLVTNFLQVPVVSLDAGGASLHGLLSAVGVAFTLGVPVRHAALFTDRFTRPLTLDGRPRFLINPCELAPAPDTTDRMDNSGQAVEEHEDCDPVLSPLASAVNAPDKPVDLLRQLIAARAEIPLAMVQPGDHLLGDLHLNSIAVSQLIAEAARSLDLAPPADPGDYANATVAEAALALEQLRGTCASHHAAPPARFPAGVDSWIRAFTVELQERPQPRYRRSETTSNWQVFAPEHHPFAERLRAIFAEHGEGSGVIVCMPAHMDEAHLKLIVAAARAALTPSGVTRFVLVQQTGIGASVARTFHLEAPQITTCVVNVPFDHPQAANWVLTEALSGNGYTEAHYDWLGCRREPFLKLLAPARESIALPLGPQDVLLVTGGGKGITAECALALASDTGARLALLGRSQPADDPELAANLARISALGISSRYIVTDITNPQAVRVAVDDIESTLGRVTGILHGAATNQPCLLAALDEARFQRTIAPKIAGIRNILAALDPDQLRMLVSFGSIIARTGLPGEADYGLANEWLTQLTEEFHVEHPGCRCLAIEWSVWSDIGMGARLGRITALMREGIIPIPPDQGIAMLRQLLSQSLPGVAVVVTSRYGALPTLMLEQPELPFLRFLEQPKVYYPGVELIAEVELSADTDPYLNDHVLNGDRIFPAVMGLEAMAQVVAALAGRDHPWVFEDVRFDRPVILPPRSSVTIRLAGLVRAPDLVEVVLRSEATSFQLDHFRARCRLQRPENDASTIHTGHRAAVEARPAIDLSPERDLYGSLLFHTGRFRRLRNYRALTATSCVAEMHDDATTSWFGNYLPPTLLLGDAGVRDTTIHAIQACVPHLTLLPIFIQRLISHDLTAPGPWLIYAQERQRDGDTFIYDVEVRTQDGKLREQWEGLYLRVVGTATRPDAWAEPLLGPYIQRRFQELNPDSALSMAIERAVHMPRRVRSDLAIQRAIGVDTPFWRRPDGKPEVAGHDQLSVAHTHDLTLAVAGAGPLGCDLEPVIERPEVVWRDLLGVDRLPLVQVIVRETNQTFDEVATRIWAAAECLKKAGVPANAPLVFHAATPDSWVLLSSGMLLIATFVTHVRNTKEQLALAILSTGTIFCQPTVMMPTDLRSVTRTIPDQVNQ